MTKAILVTGATGKQGGAVVKALLEAPNAADYTILAVTRKPESASATKLVEKGVKIVQGDLNDVPAIFESAKKVASMPIWGVFSVQVRVDPLYFAIQTSHFRAMMVIWPSSQPLSVVCAV
jgi:NAD(P)-dependent dehydrogenase (short-subunit alcohol dehydrogenase family)